jgi:MSHA biogenesis protein MshO
MRRQRGFNLIELVVIIVVIGALMAGTAAYITNSVTAYNAVARRDQLTSLGRVTIERIVRDLRTALPNSVRVSNNCIEFLPILSGSTYLSLPVDSAGTSFTAADFTLPAYSGAAYVVVYPYNQTPLYAQSNPGSLVTFSAKAGTPISTVTLGSSFRFAHHAPHRRFYVVNAPISYCVLGTNLNRYRGYSLSAAQATPPSASAELVAENIQLNDSGVVVPFRYTPGTLQRNAIVALDFRFLIDGEWIRLSHEVQVRNVL